MALPSPLDLTKVRLQASGDKRMIESMKKTVRTAGMLFILTLPPVSLIGLLAQAREVYSTGLLALGCARCLTRCVGFGHMMRARSIWELGRMRLRGN